MPLSFHSVTHGKVAFGFFNIDSDMLLLEHYFFFADDFCERVSTLAENEGQNCSIRLKNARHIADPEAVGDLMGAIHGVRHIGFIGDVYRRFPFPSVPEDFRQKPDGFKNRAILELIIDKYSQSVDIPFTVHKDSDVTIGPYGFDRRGFHELIRYVWRGGYPRWLNGVRPDYVVAMKETINRNRTGIFEGIVFEAQSAHINC